MSFLRLTGEAAPDVEALQTWLDAPAPGSPLLIETSGSTGEPKRVVLSRAAVLASARASAARVGSGRWWLTLPSSYVAGINVIVRSLLAGHPPVLGDSPGDASCTSLVPTQLRRMLTTDLDRLRALDVVLLGGGPIDPSLRRRAESLGVRVVATYGSSETCGGCVYDGVPLDGVDVRIDPSDARIGLRGPMLFTEYDGDPVLTAETLVDGWFLTSDLGRLDDDGRLRVLGRLDDMVLSGGVNVPAPAVAARLREHPAVHDAVVIGVPDHEWGQRVVAYVVGRLTLAEARDWVAVVHPRAWAPRELCVLDELPLLANGKVDLVRLRAW
ncbi:MAG TPA: AMP-binding protein [Nocardioides sp.]